MEEVTNPVSEQVKPVNTPAPAQSISTPDPLKKKGGKKNIFIILGILAAVGIGIFLISSGTGSPDSDASPSPESDLYDFATPEPTDSPDPADRTDISIEVLNGTGIAGEASFLQGKLRTLGYEDVETGNADDQDNETTTVTFSEDVPDEIVEEITEEEAIKLKDKLFPEHKGFLCETVTPDRSRFIWAMRFLYGNGYEVVKNGKDKTP